MDLSDKKIITSPYRRGADFGFLFGIYLTVMFFGSIFAGSLPLGGILSFVLMLGVPVFIFIALWRYDRELQGCATFPMMWMAGVVTTLAARDPEQLGGGLMSPTGLLVRGNSLYICDTFARRIFVYQQ